MTQNAIDKQQEEVKKQKSRNQSTYEYFETLQLEFIVADLRSKIYPKLKDKNFWKKVKEGKKATIIDIASRNTLPSIFDDEELLFDLKKRVYNNESIATFIYKDQDHKLNQEYYDWMYYFNKGAEFRFNDGNETKIVLMIDYKPFEKNAIININGKDEKVPVSKLTRII